MGMFDWYEPATPYPCAECGEAMTRCQGQEDPNALFVWKEGISGMAIAHRVDEPLDRLEWDGLPHRFTFTCWCPNDHSRDFVGECVDGIWSRTVPTTVIGSKGRGLHQ